MSRIEIKPTQKNWREFCEESPLTDEEYDEWLRLCGAVKAHGELYEQLLKDVPGNRKPTVFGDPEDWSDVVAEIDAKRIMARAELAWWRSYNAHKPDEEGHDEQD